MNMIAQGKDMAVTIHVDVGTHGKNDVSKDGGDLS
jgi:hypothetical protein